MINNFILYDYLVLDIAIQKRKLVILSIPLFSHFTLFLLFIPLFTFLHFSFRLFISSQDSDPRRFHRRILDLLGRRRSGYRTDSFAEILQSGVE